MDNLISTMVQIRDLAIDRGELSEYFMLIPNEILMVLFAETGV